MPSCLVASLPPWPRTGPEFRTGFAREPDRLVPGLRARNDKGRSVSGTDRPSGTGLLLVACRRYWRHANKDTRGEGSLRAQPRLRGITVRPTGNYEAPASRRRAVRAAVRLRALPPPGPARHDPSPRSREPSLRPPDRSAGAGGCASRSRVHGSVWSRSAHYPRPWRESGGRTRVRRTRDRRSRPQDLMSMRKP